MKKDYEKMWVAMGNVLQANAESLKKIAPATVSAPVVVTSLVASYLAIDEIGEQHIDEKAFMRAVGDRTEAILKERGLIEMGAIDA